MANGALHSVFIIPETTYGVRPTSGAWQKWRQNAVTLALTKGTLQSSEIRDDRMPGDTRLGTRQVGGNINGEVSIGTWDAVLEACLGGTWTGDILKGGTTRRSFSILRDFTDLPATEKRAHYFTGCEVNTIDFGVTANAIATLGSAWVGQDLTLEPDVPSSQWSPHPPTTTEVIDSFTGALTEGGMNIGVVTEITFNITNGIEPRFVVGSKTTIRPSISSLVVTGQMTAYFESTALLEKFINEEKSSIELDLVDKTGGTLTIKLPEVVYTGGQPDVNGEGPITLPMPFTANYNPCEGSNIIFKRKGAGTLLRCFTLQMVGSATTVAEGATLAVGTPIVQPTGASLGTVTYQSSDEDIFTVDGSTGTVTGVKAGTANLIAKSDLGVSTYIEITVTVP